MAMVSMSQTVAGITGTYASPTLVGGHGHLQYERRKPTSQTEDPHMFGFNHVNIIPKNTMFFPCCSFEIGKSPWHHDFTMDSHHRPVQRSPGDFTWAGKAVGGFIVLFGVSIVVVPMSVTWRKIRHAVSSRPVHPVLPVALESLFFFRESIPIYGRKIQVSDFV